MSHASYFNSSLLQESGILLTTYDIVRNNYKLIRGDFYNGNVEGKYDKLLHYYLVHLSSTTTPSRGATTKSVADAESRTDICLHPEPWHGEPRLDDVLKKSRTPMGVAIVSAKAWSILSTTYTCRHEVTKMSAMRSDP